MADSASSPEVPVREGDILAGKYRVERVLGAGGMGVVVQATHLELDSTVALKFMLREVAESSPEAVKRFLREAKIASGLRSEHVVRVSDVGRFATGEPYMVMEYLSGRDLAEVLETDGALSIERAVGYIVQACEAVAEAHVKGIVHRDLKPANMFLTKAPDGSDLVKVLDFGISKISKPDGTGKTSGLTATTAVFGTPLYMSPEQIQSAKRVDARTDIWALGVILFELLTGQIPFNFESIPGLIAAIATESPTTLAQAGVSAPPLLEAILRRALKRNREERFPTVSAFVKSLQPFVPPAQHHIVSVIERIQPIPPDFVPPTETDPNTGGATNALPARQPSGSWEEHSGPRQASSPSIVTSSNPALAPTLAGDTGGSNMASTGGSGSSAGAQQTHGAFGVTSDPATGQQASSSRKGVAVLAVAGGAVLLAIVGAGGWLLSRQSDQGAEAAAASSASSSAGVAEANSVEPDVGATAEVATQDEEHATPSADASSKDAGKDVKASDASSPPTVQPGSRKVHYTWPPKKVASKPAKAATATKPEPAKPEPQPTAKPKVEVEKPAAESKPKPKPASPSDVLGDRK